MQLAALAPQPTGEPGFLDRLDPVVHLALPARREAHSRVGSRLQHSQRAHPEGEEEERPEATIGSSEEQEHGARDGDREHDDPEDETTTPSPGP